MIRQLPQRLHDEGLVRIGRRAEQMNTARMQFDHERSVVGHQAAPSSTPRS